VVTFAPTAEAVLRCARVLIIGGGYNGFSYADIATVVGIRKASIHHHFPTKLDLVRALVKQYREEAEIGFAAIERDIAEPLDQITSYTGYWESCIGDPETGFCLCALLATQMPVLPEEIVQEVQAYFQALSNWLASALDRGAQQGSIVLSTDARSEAETLMAVVHGAMMSARAYGDPLVFATITRLAIDRLRPQTVSGEGDTFHPK
jgi:TetR/AcrR family transcriptional regulator, transcriptional repressor for nem operon